jgi:hypothetical protein
MNWKDLLKTEIQSTYAVSDRLINLVDKNSLDWKPSSGKNWLTTGQLLSHISDACGMPMKGFVTGDWGLPEGVDVADLSPEEMLPPAEKFPSVRSVKEARDLLEKDKLLALEILNGCSEEDLAGKMTKAPWDSSELVLGYRLLQMILHLSHHKSQLFYYLKLQGKDVNTSHLWGG